MLLRASRLQSHTSGSAHGRAVLMAGCMVQVIMLLSRLNSSKQDKGKQAPVFHELQAADTGAWCR